MSVCSSGGRRVPRVDNHKILIISICFETLHCTITINWRRVPRVDDHKDIDVIVLNVEGLYDLQLQLIGGWWIKCHLDSVKASREAIIIIMIITIIIINNNINNILIIIIIIRNSRCQSSM